MKMNKKTLAGLVLAAVLVILLIVYMTGRPGTAPGGDTEAEAGTEAVTEGTETAETASEAEEEGAAEESGQPEEEIIDEAELELEEGEASGGM